ncbi:MarR family winged helix-turn-helix transcriptional regulator [Endobacterium cereale]|uniref:MarR family winged helix-turn-helix transcriptional regulator n=1 Tax=Endobacterium cereale TaxID=2663029 RepID=UPI002B4664A3|nr:MarR family transcriptional regulator [Endobacterium cereale]MEB2848039.1 MarR family transcriptional regulator [Endobacterium cereale]
MDQVDKVIEQWREVRPDLDTSTMGPIGRLTRAMKFMQAAAEQTFAAYNLNMAGFDVLSALRRSGSPYALSPGDLLASMMITSGTMTNRIDQLEKAGLVKRENDPNDARKAIVRLTPEGLQRIEGAIVEHIDTQRELLLSGLTEKEVTQLDKLLRKLTRSLNA